ncbi:MAG: GH3 auxin-responsive promoter family protein [Bacteroidales bacterium]|nr:GH3 auxin-responsive promoter family protein [Bacteroidales bacterium]
MAIINNIINTFSAGRLSKIADFAQNGDTIQREQLEKNLCKAKNTAFGLEHSFSSIKTYKEYADRVPVVDYEHFSPFIERMIKGEDNVVWPGHTRWFAKSSGTTNAKSKFIPVTNDVLDKCHYQGGRDVIYVYTKQNPESKMFMGKSLILGGSKKISAVNSRTVEGDLSAIMISNTPKWLNFFKTPSPDIALLDKWEEKLEKITAYTMHQNVTSLAGVPSWFLILIKHILQVAGKENLHEIWPNLELFIHGGINFTPYREQYKALAPKGINFLETYNASEGFFALQDDPSQNGMLLMLDYGTFYEFVPMSEIGNPHPKSYTIEDVEMGVDYALVISTNGGLWRYMIGDTVRFVSLNPHRIIISGRTKHYINAFGEEVMIDNAEKALLKATQATGAVIRDYTAAPVFMGTKKQGCHEWLIEFEKDPSDFELFRTTLDKALQEVNSDYEAKRYKDITLGGPILTVARQGLFYDWMSSRGKLGGQNKVPRLSNNREYIDQLLTMNK